jgi:hypothetical protein
MPHRQGPPAGLPDHRERLVEEIVQRRPLLQPEAEFPSLVLELLVAEGLNLGFEGVDGDYARGELAEFPLILGADEKLEDRVEKHPNPMLA